MIKTRRGREQRRQMKAERQALKLEPKPPTRARRRREAAGKLIQESHRSAKAWARKTGASMREAWLWKRGKALPTSRQAQVILGGRV